MGVDVSSRTLHAVDFKPKLIKTLPDTYSNQTYAKLMRAKSFHRVIAFQTKVVFIGLPDYKVFDRRVWESKEK